MIFGNSVHSWNRAPDPSGRRRVLWSRSRQAMSWPTFDCWRYRNQSHPQHLLSCDRSSWFSLDRSPKHVSLLYSASSNDELIFHVSFWYFWILNIKKKIKPKLIYYSLGWWNLMIYGTVKCRCSLILIKIF